MPPATRSFFLVCLGVLGFAAAALRAQTVPATPAANSTEGEPVKLSVFEVTIDKDLGYAASTALSGTRTNEKLGDLPNTISVMTQEFMQDLGLNNYFDAINFAPNAENTFNDTGTIGAVVGQRSGNQVNIRGLASVRQLRDGFPWYLVADVYNTERIEFGRGPGGLAYGDVDAGGTVSIATKRATFRRAASTQVRYDNFGTQRYSIDVNQPLLTSRLGVRFNAINSEIQNWRQRNGRDLEAYAGALRFEPFKHRRTQLDAMYETGNSTYHLGSLGPLGGEAAYVRGTGTTNLDADPNRAGTQVHGVGRREIRAANSAAHAWVDIDGTISNWQSTATNRYRVSTVIQTTAAVSATDPQNPLLIPIMRVSENIVPMKDDWAGPDQKANSKYHAYTIELKHTFSDRLHVLVAHNAQFDETVRKQTYTNISALNGIDRNVVIDVNPIIPDPNGPGTIPNPNFEKYFIAHTPLLNPDGHEIVNWRGQAVYDARLPWNIKQRVVLGANYRHEEYYQNMFTYSLTAAEIARRGYIGTAATFPNNAVVNIHYLDLGGSDQALGWNVRPGITQLFRQTAGNGVNRRLDQSLTSGSANVIGSYFNGKLRSSIGVSREHWLQSASTPTRADAQGEQRFVAADGVALLPNRGTDKIDAPVLPFANNWSTNQAFGAVWHALPWVSLTTGYFESSQFSDNYGLDLSGNALQPITGEGMDYSVRLHLLGGRVEASVVYFETTQENLRSSVSALARDELNPLLARPFVNLVDYRDRTSTGWEYQVTTNLTRRWTLVAHYSRNDTRYTRFFPLLEARITEARATAQARGLNPDDATADTAEYLQNQDSNIGTNKRITASLSTRYSFTEGKLKGFTTGVSASFVRGKPWAAKVVSATVIYPARLTDSYVLANPFFSYRKKFGRTSWTFQANINNVANVRSNQGNSYGWARYTEPRQFVYTTTVGF